MTADEARAMKAKAEAVDPEKVRIVLDRWHVAIRAATVKGLSAVRESDIGRVRTPVPEVAYEAARAILRERGFTVERVMNNAEGETTYEARW